VSIPALFALMLAANSARSADTTPTPGLPAATQVTVRGRTPGQELGRSAYAVEVVELDEHARSASDLGAVLVRNTSLDVRREGGLGSSGQYSLNGLGGDRVRFFLDGVPLEFSPYQLGIANVPLAFVDRAEVYQGVAPIRFGADAIGGAVQLVSDRNVRGTRGAASYELASFDTHRLALGLQHYLPDAGIFVRGNAFLDISENDYPVDVTVSDDSGVISPAHVRRFHDGYRGLGAELSAGLVDKSFADRLVLRAYAFDYARELQSDPGMVIPYGEVTYFRRGFGAQLRYARRFSEFARVDAVAGHALRVSGLSDRSRCRYDWYGRCLVERALSGEIDAIPFEREVTEHTLFARAQATLRPADGHAFRAAISPTHASRSGRDRAVQDAARDGLRLPRSVTSIVYGVEYEAEIAGLDALTFAKLYQQHAETDAPRANRSARELRSDELPFGAGNSLRYFLTDDLLLKASYEYAARLPSPDERFGDGALIAENPLLSAERSQNYNFGAALDSFTSKLGRFDARVTGSMRLVEDLVVLVNMGSFYQYQNVLSARGLGLEASAGWSAPEELFGAAASFGFHDLRNRTSTGPGAPFYDDRIPNTPYEDATARLFAGKSTGLVPGDRVQLSYDVRYVHSFLRGWESAGIPAAKLEIPSQTVHSLALSYVFRSGRTSLAQSLEVHNLGDARVFDFYGVERPGRSFHYKASLDYD
jgi:outer membrane receptor protein involved in Fe transport